MRKKGKGKKIALTLLILLLLLAGGVGGYLFYLRSLGTFISRTTIDGVDVSQMNPSEVTEVLKSEFAGKSFVLTENGTVDLECTLSEIGFQVDDANAQMMVERALEMQNRNPVTMIQSVVLGKNFRMEIPFMVDEEAFAAKMTAENFAVPRVETEDAYLDQGEDGYFEIIPEVYGNVFDEEEMHARLKEEISQQLMGGSENRGAFAADVFEVPFPEEIYTQPQAFASDQDMLIRKEAYNRYCRSEITYEFGSQTEVLGWDTVSEWLVFEGEDSHLDTDKIWAYIEAMAEKYDTRYHDRTFTTTMSGDVVIPGSINEYGYTLDQNAEYEQLTADLMSGEKISREPVYYDYNEFGNPLHYKRDGVDDLAGTYVEISLTLQHLWFYIDGDLVYETDVITGLPTPDRETTTGVFPLAYKESPSILVGENNSYRTPVAYWMPFYEGQGLHDATWQSAFGGSTYTVAGSHGCVNLSLDSAATIYGYIEAGMPIVLYK